MRGFHQAHNGPMRGNVSIQPTDQNLMKRIALILLWMISVSRGANGAGIFSYAATNSPGSAPDGVDQSGNLVNVWTVTAIPGGTNGLGDSGADGSGVYFGNPDGGGGIDGGAVGSWQEYSYQNDGVGLGGSVDAVNVFAGGPLTTAQTVALDFVMRATDPASGGRQPGTVGISLLNGTNAAVTFFIYGGGPGYYLYNDAATTNGDAGPMGYQYQSAFHVAFTITGPNTYTATAGSDTWNGTFKGPLTGIDVFNHAGGNASDVGFNHLTVIPELAINNVSPNDNTKLFNTTNTLTFSINSPASPVDAAGIQVILNGTNISANLQLAGIGTSSVGVTYTNLLPDQIYSGLITVTNQQGIGVTAPVQFDTFDPNYFTWEAEDFDFGGGQFIDNPIISSNSPSSYFNTVGTSNIDEYSPNYSASQPHLWRSLDEVSTSLAGDTERPQFATAGVPDYMVGYFNPGNWVNYTRTYPPGLYNIYARLANGNGGLANCGLAQVVSGQGTTSQNLQQLGIFQFSAQGWNTFNFVPLTDAWGNKVAVRLNGQTTFRITSGPLGGGVNMNFFMLAPGSNTPPAIANIYPDGLHPFEATNSISFTVTSSTSTISQNAIQVLLNGINVSSQLAFAGSSTNWLVSIPLPQQGLYKITITAADAAGHTNSYAETFDTFNQNNLMVEAGDFDFNGGQWIDSPLSTATNYVATNSYYYYPGDNPANSAMYGVDYTITNVTTAETYIYRLDGNTPGTVSVVQTAVGSEVTSDFLRDKFINLGPGTQPPFEYVPNEPIQTTNTDFDVAWWPPATWLNYTRTFPTNSYLVYARLASDAAYTNGVMSLVTSGQGTANQTAQLLGSFSDPAANGFQSWHWVPLTGGGGQPAVVTLGGQETLKVTAPSGSPFGSFNAHFFMFVPVQTAPTFSIGAAYSAGFVTVKFPTQTGLTYTVQYTDGLNPPSWQNLGGGISGDGTTKSVSDSPATATTRFYRVQAR